MSQFEGGISRRNLMRGGTIVAAGAATIVEINAAEASESPATRFQAVVMVHAQINGVEH
jgi:hypothetical protein